MARPDWYDVQELTNRTMHRLLATAKYGPQPARPGEFTEIRVSGAMTTSGREVSIAMKQDDIEAVLVEMKLGSTCGICHQDPCTFERPPAAVAPSELGGTDG